MISSFLGELQTFRAKTGFFMISLNISLMKHLHTGLTCLHIYLQVHFWKHHEKLPQVTLTKLLCNFHQQQQQQRNETVKFKIGKKSDRRLRNKYV